jgi:predicted O-methyltransferase YrrM
MRSEPDEQLAVNLLAARAQNRIIETEYPYHPRHRLFPESASGKKIIALLAKADESSQTLLVEAARYREALRTIPLRVDPDSPSPGWVNGALPGLDGIMLYTLIRTLKPRTYLEVGSGNSTKFVRKAITDGGLKTRIVSIEPYSRPSIDALCDLVIREPFENVSESVISGLLAPNDVVFIDNSHRSFQNSDVTVFFTETIALLPPGTYYGIHDIFLPSDYPEAWLSKYYNEQYLLTAYLLGGAGGDRVIFPGMSVSVGAPKFAKALAALFEGPEFVDVERHAAAFWMRRAL